MQAQLQGDQERMLDVMARADSWPREWRDAAVRRGTFVALDPEQVAALHAELDEVIDRYRDSEPGTGARRVSVVYHLLPTEHEVDG